MIIAYWAVFRLNAAIRITWRWWRWFTRVRPLRINQNKVARAQDDLGADLSRGSKAIKKASTTSFKRVFQPSRPQEGRRRKDRPRGANGQKTAAVGGRSRMSKENGWIPAEL
jgi:hypothetical protein